MEYKIIKSNDLGKLKIIYKIRYPALEKLSKRKEGLYRRIILYVLDNNFDDILMENDIKCSRWNV